MMTYFGEAIIGFVFGVLATVLFGFITRPDPPPDPLEVRLEALEANVAHTDSLLADLRDRLAAHDSTMVEMFDYWMTETF